MASNKLEDLNDMLFNQLVRLDKDDISDADLSVDFISSRWLRRDHRRMAEGANVFVPDSQPLACFTPLTRAFNDRYELFKACKEENVRIYESKEHEDEN